jgi:hypothetical protein
MYRALAAALDVPEEILRDRTQKESGVEVGGLLVIPRHLLRTFGTDWGRELVHPDVWVRLAMARVDRVAALTRRDVFSICGTRFPNELQAVRERDGEVWWIDRPGIEPPPPHRSDEAIFREDCDRVIVNSGTPEDLRALIVEAYEDFLEARADRIVRSENQ